MLIINDLIFDENKFKNFYDSYPIQKETCNQFLAKPIQLINSPKFLYISQGEFCIVRRDDENLTVSGSDEATTCLLLFLQTNSSCAIAHLDHAIKIESIKQLINELLDNDLDNNLIQSKTDRIRLNCSLIGSYDDEEQCSRKFIKKFLNYLNNIPDVDIDLKLACFLEANTTKNENQFNCPIIYGAAINLNEFNENNFQIFPAEFKDRGPEIILRKVRRTCSWKDLVQIYNSKNQLLIINEFRYFKINNIDLIINASDEYILANFSTSPHAEPAHFSDSIRKMYSLMNCNKIQEPTHKFKLKCLTDNDYKWIEEF